LAGVEEEEVVDSSCSGEEAFFARDDRLDVEAAALVLRGGMVVEKRGKEREMEGLAEEDESWERKESQSKSQRASERLRFASFLPPPPSSFPKEN